MDGGNIISYALIKSIVPSKLVALFTWSLSFFATAFAITEAFVGQLVIAVAVAIIGALPPTAAIIIAAIRLSKGQKEVVKAVDGQLAKFVEAKEAVSHAAGMSQERIEERDRVAEAAPAVAAAIAQAAVAAAVKSDPDRVSKMEIVNQDENAVPTRTATKRN